MMAISSRTHFEALTGRLHLPEPSCGMSQMGHKPTCAPSCRELVEQGLRLLQVRRVETLGEPAVDWSEKFSGLIPLPLITAAPCSWKRAAPRTSPAVHARRRCPYR